MDEKIQSTAICQKIVCVGTKLAVFLFLGLALSVYAEEQRYRIAGVWVADNVAINYQPLDEISVLSVLKPLLRQGELRKLRVASGNDLIQIYVKPGQ